MKIIRDSICNENGSVLLLSVVMLMLLTVLDIFATTTSTIEIQIAGNDKFYKQNFFKSDSGISLSLAWLTKENYLNSQTENNQTDRGLKQTDNGHYKDGIGYLNDSALLTLKKTSNSELSKIPNNDPNNPNDDDVKGYVFPEPDSDSVYIEVEAETNNQQGVSIIIAGIELQSSDDATNAGSDTTH